MTEGRTLILGDLHIDDCDALDHGPGLNLGTDVVATTTIAAGNVDGEEVAGYRYTNTEVLIPVIIGQQQTWAEVVDLYNELVAELIKPTNELRFGAVDSDDLWLYYIVEPADVPPLVGGRAQTPPDVRLFEGYINVVLKRLPGLPVVASLYAAATFARASVAYKQDGSLVATQTPRYEDGQFGQAVMVEEGTENLLGSTDSQGFAAPVNVTVVNGTVYTVSMTGAGSIALSGAGTGSVTSSTPITITAGSTTLTLTPTGATGRVQVEAKAYKTSWQIGGTERAAETLTIPSAGVLAATGTIEALVYVTPHGLGDTSDAHTVVQHTGIGSDLVIRRNGVIWEFFAGGGANSSGSWNNTPSVGWHHLALRWAASGVWVGYVDGVARASGTAAVPLAISAAALFIGSSPGGSAYGNALIDDLRISDTAHSDAEIAADYAAGTPLPRESDTTYLKRFDGSL